MPLNELFHVAESVSSIHSVKTLNMRMSEHSVISNHDIIILQVLISGVRLRPPWR